MAEVLWVRPALFCKLGSNQKIVVSDLSGIPTRVSIGRDSRFTLIVEVATVSSSNMFLERFFSMMAILHSTILFCR